ncbi:MAG: cobalamin-binding protein [Halanaeroarchaeum sp.]
MNLVSLAPSNTEILYRLGVGDRIVATTAHCDYPEGALEKPSIGGWIDPDVESVREFSPDLVIASDDLQDRVVDRLSEGGYPVLQVSPHTLGEVYESIEAIGEAVNRAEEARKLVASMREELESISVDGSPRLYFEEWMDPPMASGNWIPDLVRKIGGESFLDPGERSRTFELAELEAFDPDHIVVNVCGAGETVETDPILERGGWATLDAVTEGNVTVVNDSLFNRPGPRLVEAAARTAAIVRRKGVDEN